MASCGTTVRCRVASPARAVPERVTTLGIRVSGDTHRRIDSLQCAADRWAGRRRKTTQKFRVPTPSVNDGALGKVRENIARRPLEGQFDWEAAAIVNGRYPEGY